MQKRKVAIVHYTCPPVIGGVETVIQEQARIFVKNGHKVKIIAGEGEKKDNIEFRFIPEIRSLSVVDKDLDKKLKKGEIPERFDELRKKIYVEIKKELQDVDVCIIHNVMTMHFNLPFTCALKELIEKLSPGVRFYIWCHDLALFNPAYQQHIPDVNKYPWNVLSSFIRNATYIAISGLRQRQIAKFFGVEPKLIKVIPVGINLKSFLGISDPVWNFALDKDILEADIVMFFPSRMLKRKNYELGIRIVSEIKKGGKRCKFIITAPPDPHNLSTVEYFDYLHKLCKKFDVENEVIFLSDWKEIYGLKLDYKEVRDFYSLCDALFVTSKEEGFCIPLLEAGAKNVPIICTDIEPLPEVVDDNALKINPDEEPSRIAVRIINYLNNLPTFLMHKKVLAKYSWEAIYKNYLKDLVN